MRFGLQLSIIVRREIHLYSDTDRFVRTSPSHREVELEVLCLVGQEMKQYSTCRITVESSEVFETAVVLILSVAAIGSEACADHTEGKAIPIRERDDRPARYLLRFAA